MNHKKLNMGSTKATPDSWQAPFFRQALYYIYFHYIHVCDMQKFLSDIWNCLNESKKGVPSTSTNTWFYIELISRVKSDQIRT